MLETGKLLQERYRVAKHVGQGGMGSVYLATDERFQSTVAIKEALFGDEKYKKAFEREARLLNSLKHSALPKVTDHFTEEHGQYIVMEYIGGDDLFETMQKAGRSFPVTDVLEWASQLIEALKYLHEQGIIHRDIKPQNLKLTPQGRIILLDFGLAKGNPTDANYQTAAQSIFGYSRNYASLEQIQGTGTDPRSDVYSLAATLYHLMTNRVPADALTRVMKVVNENRDPLEPAGLFNSEISQEVSDALDRCLALKAASRPASAFEMEELLLTEESTPFAATTARETAPVAEGDLLTQNTKILDERSGMGTVKPSEFKTEVLPQAAGDSVQTRVANRPTGEIIADTDASPRRSKVWGAAAAFGVIAIVIGAVAATVTFIPTTTLEVTPPEPAQIDSGLVADPAETPLPAEGLETEKDQALDAIENTRREVAERPQPAAKPAPKTAAKSTETATGLQSDGDGSGATLVTEDGKVKIKGSTIETDEVKVNEKGVVFKQTPRPTPRLPIRGLPITREQYEKMTPAQQRRVREELRRRGMLPPRRSVRRRPPPPATPKP